MSETTQIVKEKRKMNRDTKQSIIVLIAFAVMMAFFGIKSEYFLKPSNLVTLFVSAVPLGLIAIAQSSCLLTCNFDMSVGMVASLGGVIWTWLIVDMGVSTYAAFAIGLAAGLISGLIAGASTAYMKVPAWISTFALMQIWNGVILIITNGDAYRMTKYADFKWLGQFKVFSIEGVGVPPAVFILVIAYILFFVLLKYTKLGRELFIIGGNQDAARNAGVNINRGILFVFTMSGFLSSLAGMLFASRSGSGQPIIGDFYSMHAIAGSVIGGTAMTGGKTNPLMTFVGMMMVTCLQNGLNMIGVPAYYQHLVTGSIVILAIWVQTERRK